MDVFGGGDCTPLRELGNDFHLECSFTRSTGPKRIKGLLGLLFARGKPAGTIAKLRFGGSNPDTDAVVEFGVRNGKLPKFIVRPRLVLYPEDVTPLCALTTRTPESSPTTEFRFSPWKKAPRAGLFLRLVVPEAALAKVPGGTPYHVALRNETLKRLGISPDTARGCVLDELDCCIAEYETCRLRHETGVGPLSELLAAEIFVRRVVLRQPNLDPLEQKDMRRKMLACMQRLLVLRKAEFEAGTLPIEEVKIMEEQIAYFREVYLPEDKLYAELIELAEKHLVKVYGERVLKERPWRVADNGDTLTIKGKKLPPGCRGGVAEIVIRKSDGKILKCIHYK